ncbi:flagellar motor switch protein FliN [Caulobacter sp. DWR1-3-2b1]|uniref:flagellar motor switch protein FliN n=1 Tax=Caulobacter sp. DWR1-3-2b1 TaxID=2804670 RepID=UPI003CFB6F70
MTLQSKITPPAGTASGAADVGAPLVSLEAALFQDVKVKLRARLGEIEMSVQELLALRSGEVLKLDRRVSEPVDLYVNQALIARGEIVAVDDHFGVRIVEIAAAP